MKSLLSVLFLLLPATLATDTCVAESGCTGCGQVASVSFVQSGNEHVATAPGWATMTVSDSIIALENLSGSTLTVCNYAVVCYYISPNSDCTVGEPDHFNFQFGLQVWQHP